MNYHASSNLIPSPGQIWSSCSHKSITRYIILVFLLLYIFYSFLIQMIVIKTPYSPTFWAQMWIIKHPSNFIAWVATDYNNHSLFLKTLKYSSEGSWARTFRLQIDMAISPLLWSFKWNRKIRTISSSLIT